MTRHLDPVAGAWIAACLILGVGGGLLAFAGSHAPPRDDLVLVPVAGDPPRAGRPINVGQLQLEWEQQRLRATQNARLLARMDAVYQAEFKRAHATAEARR